MPEMDNIEKYLRKTLERLVAKVINSLPDEHYQKAIFGADFLEIDELTNNSILGTRYTKGKHLDRAENAYIDNVSLLIKAKQSFDNGDIQKTIELLFNYHFLLGQIQQSITEEDGFKALATEQTTPGRDGRYLVNRQIREKACTLLYEHKPENGWENIPTASEEILQDLENFTKKIISETNTDCNIKPENLLDLLDGWMRNNKYEVRAAFMKTASQKWINRHVKNK